VQTVLGLSMTASSVGWVLLDGQGLNAATLDHDAFDVQSSTDGDASDTSQHTAAARGAQSIATTSGHKVGSVRVTWTEDVEGAATTLLKSLADLGFDNVHAISLSKATQTWGIEIGRQNELTKSGLCILEPNAATVMIVATGAGSVRTAVTDTRETAQDLIDWLRTVFGRAGWMPERLYVLGALDDLDKVLEPIADALPIPVSDSADIQLALARGAALATVSQFDAGSSHAAETPRERPWRLSRAKKSITPADADTVVVATVSQIDGDSSQAVETPHSELRVDTQSDRPWLASHAKKMAIAAAAAAVFGAALSLAAGSAINVEKTSAQAADPAAEAAAPTAEGASVTSPSAHTVPAPSPASPPPQVQPLAAPPPARPTPPKTFAPPAESVAALAPKPVALPQHGVSASPPADVSVTAPDAQPPAAPLAVPVAPQFVAPLGALPGPPPVAPLGALPGPPPVAPLGALPGPPPVAPLGALPGPPPVAPLGALPGPPPVAPLAVPPAPQPAAPFAVPAVAAPAPIAPPPAAAPAPSEPADAPPPPDPVQAVMSPLFGALP
jgi:hypothetical protein